MYNVVTLSAFYESNPSSLSKLTNLWLAKRVPFLKVLACQMPIHVKMGDPAYGGHAIGKRTLNLIIHWLRRSPIGIVNGRTLVRYWNTSVAQWRLAWRPRRGRIRRVSSKAATFHKAKTITKNMDPILKEEWLFAFFPLYFSCNSFAFLYSLRYKNMKNLTELFRLQLFQWTKWNSFWYYLPKL